MLLFFLLNLYTVACTELSPLNLWPSIPPGENGFVCGPEALVKSIYPYATDRRYYNVSVPTLTPYLVTNGTGAAVVVAPGGGYSELNWDDEGTRVSQRLNSFGVSALLLKYRVPKRPDATGMPYATAQLMDAQRAMGLARKNAAAWGLNASKIGFMGFSAGGHLTAHISTSWQKRLYPPVDSADELSCRPDFSLLVYPWKLLLNNDKDALELAPELAAGVDATHPPAFFANNLDDNTAYPENSLLYVKKLHLAGAPKGSLHLYPSGGHGFGVCAELNPVGGFLQCCEFPLHALRFLQNNGMAPGWPYNITG